MLALVLGGVLFFIYALPKLSETMQDIATEKAKQVVAQYTRNIVLSILFGALLTIILGSYRP
ncbi:MAG: hypothetical protein AAF717_15635 [Bacteroidota bacterium]